MCLFLEALLLLLLPFMFPQLDPTVQATVKFLHLLKVKANETTVSEVLQNHPDWPTLLCISDTLTRWNIANGAGRIAPVDLGRVPTPFLAKIKDEAEPLVVITDVSAEQVTMYARGYRNPLTISRSTFIDKWTGIYLVAEPSEESGEPGYHRNKERALYRRLTPTGAIALLLVLFTSLAHSRVGELTGYTSKGFFALSVYAQLLVLLAGSVITVALVWHEIDSTNPLLERVCSSLAKSNCNAILSGKKAKVFSWLSWSEVGLFYFCGNLLVLLFSKNSAILTIVGWLTILSLPYTLFSVYYQWKIAKQWCVLCLAVQTLLLLGSLNIIVSGTLFSLPRISLGEFIMITLWYLLLPLVWYSVKPTLLQLHESKDTKRQYLRLKFNSELFDTLLKNQKAINNSVDHLGITLGNPHGSNTIIKVCSPYCGPCSNAHPKIDQLLQANDDLKVKIIFLIPDQESNAAFKPARHLLALAEQGNSQKLHQALDDWYLPKSKEYDQFAARYPLEQVELRRHDPHIVAMRKWCNQEGIVATPTVFLNGHQLPSSYHLEDLNYLLLTLPALAKQ